MKEFTAIFKALERLTSSSGTQAKWNSHGVDFSFTAPFQSEFLPNLGFMYGHCRYPNSPELDTQKKPSFLIQIGNNNPPAEWTPFTTLHFWSTEPKISTTPLRLHWVEQNPDMNEYFSLDINDQMMSGTPFDPYTDRYLVKEGNKTVGKIRVTDCGDGYRLATRPYLLDNSRALDLFLSLESTAAKNTKQLLVIQDSLFTADVLKSCKKMGKGFISYSA